MWIQRKSAISPVGQSPRHAPIPIRQTRRQSTWRRSLQSPKHKKRRHRPANRNWYPPGTLPLLRIDQPWRNPPGTIVYCRVEPSSPHQPINIVNRYLEFPVRHAKTPAEIFTSYLQLRLPNTIISPGPRIYPVQDILCLDPPVQAPPGLESPALNLGRNLRWEDWKVANMFAKDLGGGSEYACTGLSVLGSWTEDVENGREVVD